MKQQRIRKLAKYDWINNKIWKKNLQKFQSHKYKNNKQEEGS